MRARCFRGRSRGRSPWRSAALLVLLGAAAALGDNPSPPQAWDAVYELDPTNMDAVSQGDDWIRQLKIDLRERLEPEVHFGQNGDENGLLRVGSGRCFVGTAAPTVIEQAEHRNTGAAGSATLSDAAFGAGGELIGHGRCWLDTDGPDDVAGTFDDDTLWLFDAANGWEQVSGVGPNLVKPGGPNLLYNGDFEIDGDTSTNTPVGWTTTDGGTGSGGPTFVHNDNVPGGAGATEGAGLRLTMTSDADADGADSVNQQLDGLKASTSYRVAARVQADATFTCQIDVTGEASASNLPDVTTTTAAFETLTGSFTTDATPSAVTLLLQGDPDTADSVCNWDHVSVVEQSVDPVGDSRGFLWTSTSTATTSWADNAGDTHLTALDSPVFEVPADNCYVKADYTFGWSYTDTSNSSGADPEWRFVLQYRSPSGGSWTTMAGNARGRGGDPANIHVNSCGGIIDETADGMICGNAFFHINDGSSLDQDVADAVVYLMGVVGDLTAGDSLELRILADQINAGAGGTNVFALDATAGVTSVPHQMIVEMVCP